MGEWGHATAHPELFTGIAYTVREETKLRAPRHTLADLLAIPIVTPNKLVRCVAEEPPIYRNPVESIAWENAFKSIFVEHQVVRAKGWRMPQFSAWFDRIRFAAHRKLLQWKVIV